ncbi:hypothetical protein RclHR1_01600016 [Rhizophagus clarus]|uniref:Ubiquitin, putative n=1 Tax=Rhizophagus clarus TaxID=94130 RepID=A0A2Z6QVS4_9GLOM|nr:hypothetical protein RclHR1_01600016 [Rhizophagus clarus]GES94032.1 ubiquitin, putative [Rhizophagus clarus]
MKIIIRTCQSYGGNMYSVEVEDFDQISVVKRKISNNTDIDCNNKSLTFNNRQLIQEMKSLSDYEIQHESTLHLRCGQCGC